MSASWQNAVTAAFVQSVLLSQDSTNAMHNLHWPTWPSNAGQDLACCELCCMSDIQWTELWPRDITAQRSSTLASRPRMSDVQLCLLVYKPLYGLWPSYLADMLLFYFWASGLQPLSGVSGLQQSGYKMFNVPWTRLQVGKHSSSVAGSAVWNNLPTHVHTSETLTVFKSLLNTHLFVVSHVNWTVAAVTHLTLWGTLLVTFTTLQHPINCCT